jgi:hypothetical protein
MTVYVDDSAIPADVTDAATGRRYRNRWSHLTADTKDELHAFAKRLGLRRVWFQDKPHGLWHYDVTAPKRAQAIRLGAQPISWRDRSVWSRPGREGRPVPAPAADRENPDRQATHPSPGGDR